MTGIESPCRLICAMDEETGYCLGCGRTRDEIAGWISMRPQERRVVMDGLPARLNSMKRRPSHETRRARLTREGAKRQ